MFGFVRTVLVSWSNYAFVNIIHTHGYIGYLLFSKISLRFKLNNLHSAAQSISTVHHILMSLQLDIGIQSIIRNELICHSNNWPSSFLILWHISDFYQIDVNFARINIRLN